MNLFSEYSIIITFLLILFISFYFSRTTSDYDQYAKSQNHTFISIFASLSLLLLVIFYYNLLRTQNLSYLDKKFDEVKRLNDNTLSIIINDIKKSYKKIPYFVSSLTPLLISKTEQKDDENIENLFERRFLSFKIFSLWQNFINSERLLYDEDLSCIYNFLQNANSVELKKEWDIIKHYFSKKTIMFGDFLFLRGLKIKNQETEEYLLISKEILQCKEYTNL